MAEVEYEFQVEIDKHTYGMDTLSSVHVKQPLFDKFDIGLACCAEMTVQYYVIEGIDPSKGAKLIPRCRPRDTQDPWKQLGVFFIDIRKERAGKMTLTCYDRMMMADTPYLKDGMSLDDWPMPMDIAAQKIATRMGTTLDPRTVLNHNYTLDYPNDDPMRRMLEYMAAAHAGNWIMTANDQLLLVPIASSMPPETHYLIEEWGRAIVIGKDRILV